MTSEKVNERRNSMLMTRHYPDLVSASDWMKQIFNQSEALPRFLMIVKHVFFFHDQVALRGDYKKDVEDVKETAIKMLSREYRDKEFRLINGYRRVDPRRGAEYILDIGIKASPGSQQEIIRCYF